MKSTLAFLIVLPFFISEIPSSSALVVNPRHLPPLNANAQLAQNTSLPQDEAHEEPSAVAPTTNLTSPANVTDCKDQSQNGTLPSGPQNPSPTQDSPAGEVAEPDGSSNDTATPSNFDVQPPKSEGAGNQTVQSPLGKSAPDSSDSSMPPTDSEEPCEDDEDTDDEEDDKENTQTPSSSEADQGVQHSPNAQSPSEHQPDDHPSLSESFEQPTEKSPTDEPNHPEDESAQPPAGLSKDYSNKGSPNSTAQSPAGNMGEHKPDDQVTPAPIVPSEHSSESPTNQTVQSPLGHSNDNSTHAPDDETAPSLDIHADDYSSGSPSNGTVQSPASNMGDHQPDSQQQPSSNSIVPGEHSSESPHNETVQSPVGHSGEEAPPAADNQTFLSPDAPAYDHSSPSPNNQTAQSPVESPEDKTPHAPDAPAYDHSSESPNNQTAESPSSSSHAETPHALDDHSPQAPVFPAENSSESPNNQTVQSPDTQGDEYSCPHSGESADNKKPHGNCNNQSDDYSSQTGSNSTAQAPSAH